MLLRPADETRQTEIVLVLKEVRRRPHYRLADLLAQMPELTPEFRAWEEMEPVGREFGAR
jgi:hypothetical protein